MKYQNPLILFGNLPDLVCACALKEILHEWSIFQIQNRNVGHFISYDTTFEIGDFYVSTLLF